MKTIIPGFEIESPYEEEWTRLESLFISVEEYSADEFTAECLQEEVLMLLKTAILEERRKAAS